jgi:colicin import membrane protein
VTYDDVTSKERRLSGALALVMHALFLGLLVFGFSWQKQHIESAMIVELWSSLPPLPKPEPPPPEPPKPVPKAQPKPLPEPPKPVPKVEPKPVIDPEIALRKEKLEKERKQKEAEEAKRKKELELAEAKKLAEKKARDAAVLKAKQEKEAAAKAAREKEEALQKLAQAQQAAQDKVMNDYVHGIRERIKRYVVLPPNMQGNPEAQFDVVQRYHSTLLEYLSSYSIKLRN